MVELYAKGREAEPELKKQIRNMLPSVLTDQFSATCLGIVNIIMAGNVSREVLAGVGQVDVINQVLSNCFITLATAGTVVAAQNIGRKDRQNAERAFRQAAVFGTLFFTAFSLLFTALRPQILYLLYGGVERRVMENALSYAFWSFLSLPFTFLFSLCAGTLRAADSVKLPMAASILINSTNIALGFFLIIGVNGSGGYGAFGAGMTIFISRLTGMLFLVFAMMRKKSPVRLTFGTDFKLEPGIIKEILSIGIPSCMETFFYFTGRLIIQVYIALMGTVMISSNAVLQSSIDLFCLPLNAYNTVMVTLVAQRAGTGSRRRSDDALRYIGSRSEKATFCSAIALFILAPFVCRIFSSDPEIIKVSAAAIRMVCPFYLALTTAFCFPMGFRGANDVRFPLVVSVFGMWVFRALGGYILGIRFGMMLGGVVAATGLDWIFRGVMYFRRMQKGDWLERINQTELVK
ncbi:MAG: MATE family efflux transporter [Bacillota bacterium]|nr:MATE family efflux transporter [Bacillota bacterium]